MKTMIISDIKGKSASIIPYGLDLAGFRKIHPDLILLDARRHSLLKNLLKKEFITRLLEETNVPVLYFKP